MRLHQRLALLYVLVLILGLSALFGCRAFEPETVIVNHPPETYLTGAPTEQGGGLFHFHLFWHGTDVDGSVVRYVWALTDSTIQDEESDDDEEDQRFNPAVNITTLNIAHWTTRTDTVFDFQIGEGAVTTRDMTFHIVAVDDRGDYDRTPARLYFLSNALGVPAIQFYNSLEQTSATRMAGDDTVGFGESLAISWNGSTPNIRSFSAAHLAERDTVPPLDGLYGFKFRLPLDIDCDDVNEDCWFPQRFSIRENRNVSYFGATTGLEFSNAPGGADVYNRLLFQGVHLLLVNSVDVAGVEVPSEAQQLQFIVNYDPDTMILGLPKDFDGEGGDPAVVLDTDPFYPDPTVYPFYRVYRPDGEITTSAFAPNDTIPHRSVAVFKAIGWDDADDTPLGDFGLTPGVDYRIAFQSKFEAWGRFRGGDSFFRFETQFSDAVPSVWDDTAVGASADTMSVLVGPFLYEFSMRAMDEHERRDGTPEIFPFSGNRPPEIECVDVVLPGTASGFPGTSCSADVDTFYVAASGDVSITHPQWTRLIQNAGLHTMWVNPTANSRLIDQTPITGGYNNVAISAFSFDFGDPADRMMSCRYEIVSHRDSLTNAIPDGSGVDNLVQVSYSFATNFSSTFDANGVWRLPVRVYVPLIMVQNGPGLFGSILGAQNPQWNADQLAHAVELVSGQLGLSTATVIARDGTKPDVRPNRCAYFYYDGVRAPLVHGERCDEEYDNRVDGLEYQFFTFESAPFLRQFMLKLVTNTGEIFPPLP